MQIVVTSNAWKLIPSTKRPDFNALFSRLLGSKADSTMKKFINEIRKFFLRCKDKHIPFSVVSLYLFNLDKQLRAQASMVLTDAALKWLHSLVPEDSSNPLDNACCKTIIECAKRTRSRPVNKKKPVDSDVIEIWWGGGVIERLAYCSNKDCRLCRIFSF